MRPVNDIVLPPAQFAVGNAANINYDSLKAMEALKRLKELEGLRSPNS